MTLRSAAGGLSVRKSVLLLASTLLLLGCSRKETVETYPDDQRKLVRYYAWPGAKDSLHLRKEIAYYINGKTKTLTHFKNGQVNGMFKAYWDNGQIKAKGNYVDDQPEGKWEYYYNAYQPAGKGAFHKGRKEGLWTEFWENGELRRRGAYHEGKQTGEWVSWSSTGGEILRTTCFESNARGHFKSSYDSGSVKEEYDCRNESHVGIYVQNHPDGNPQCRGFFDTAGIQDSLWEWFHPNGRLSARQHFHHGAWNDSMLAWDSAGHVLQKGFFHLGTGSWNRYDSHGHIVEVKSFVAGAPVFLRRWHPNGKVSSEGIYVDGKKTGMWKMWDPRGYLIESAEYLRGEFHGERRFYDSTGVLMRVQKYFHGIPTKGSLPGLKNGK